MGNVKTAIILEFSGLNVYAKKLLIAMIRAEKRMRNIICKIAKLKIK